MTYVNNKGADHPSKLVSLNSTYNIHCRDSKISELSKQKHLKLKSCTCQFESSLVDCFSGAITFALILQKFRFRLSYTCVHKSGAFALSFCDTLAPIYSQLFLGQLLVFEPCCKKIGIQGSVF